MATYQIAGMPPEATAHVEITYDNENRVELIVAGIKVGFFAGRGLLLMDLQPDEVDRLRRVDCGVREDTDGKMKFYVS